MKKLALGFTLFCGLVAGTIPALAQSTNANNNLDSIYGQWMVTLSNSVSSGAQTLIPLQCYVNTSLPGIPKQQFFPFATNVPITIVDGSNTETVTPSAVSTPTAATEPANAPLWNCSATATLSNAHNAGVQIISGDAGVAEAANTNGVNYPLTEGLNWVAGSCTGTATASATLGLYGAGGGLTTTCTSTTILDGAQQNRAFTAKNLSCTAGTGGVGSGSGVVTALKNHQGTNSTQTVTCTFGTGTTCSDTTHTFNGVAGDIVGIQFTSAGSETLANVACTLQLF